MIWRRGLAQHAAAAPAKQCMALHEQMRRGPGPPCAAGEHHEQVPLLSAVLERASRTQEHPFHVPGHKVSDWRRASACSAGAQPAQRRKQRLNC